MAIAKLFACHASAINLIATFTLYHASRPNPLNYGIHPIQHKKTPYATAPNLFKTLWQNYFY